jgi:hypothetical protein
MRINIVQSTGKSMSFGNQLLGAHLLSVMNQLQVQKAIA